MGLDFITKCAGGFQRSWDRGRDDLAEPDLLKGRVETQRRRYVAVPLDGSTFQVGQQFLGQLDGAQVLLHNSSSVIGRILNVPAELVVSLGSEGCGFCLISVVKVHEISQTADVVIC